MIAVKEPEPTWCKEIYIQDLHNQVSHTKTTPTVVLMAGFAGAGKTRLAMYLKDQLGNDWETLNKDYLKFKHLNAAKDVKNSNWDKVIEQAGWDAFEDVFTTTKGKMITEGVSIIIDSCGYPAFILEHVLEILRSQQLSVQLKVILCQAKKVTRIQRLQERGSEFKPYIYSLPTILDDSEMKERFAHLPSETLILQTDGPFDEYKEKALNYLRIGTSCKY